jgi:hypothetical protein
MPRSDKDCLNLGKAAVNEDPAARSAPTSHIHVLERFQIKNFKSPILVYFEVPHLQQVFLNPA